MCVCNRLGVTFVFECLKVSAGKIIIIIPVITKALEAGIIDAVCPIEDLKAFTMKLAQEIAPKVFFFFLKKERKKKEKPEDNKKSSNKKKGGRWNRVNEKGKKNKYKQ